MAGLSQNLAADALDLLQLHCPPTQVYYNPDVFAKRYRAEMSAPEAQHIIATLAALSRSSNFAIGCYCEDRERCHRVILEELLRDRGAVFVDGH